MSDDSTTKLIREYEDYKARIRKFCDFCKPFVDDSGKLNATMLREYVEGLEAALKQISNTDGFPSDEEHQNCVDIAKEVLAPDHDELEPQ